MDPILLQLKDHENDTDDIPDGMDPILLQTQSKVISKDHSNDTDDIPDDLEPNELHKRDKDGGWIDPDKMQMMQKEEEEAENFWKPSTYRREEQLLQIAFNHENDTEDIPEG